MSVKLSAAALAHMPAGIAVPNYRRSDLSAGIVHFGVGNFHRAHQAVYLDDLFNAGRDHDWAIVGAGVRDPDVIVREKLKEQDWLTTVVEQEAHATNIRVTGAMIDFVRPYDVAANLDMLARPQIRIVSLTVTEGGYYISPATQKFDSGHPDIVADARNIDSPKTVFGLIVAGLKRRRAAGVPPFTVMSCDNIPGNGHVTENAVAGVAELADPKLAQWIKQANVCFPNSMVDRITPATTDRERAILSDTYGLEDNWPVFCEAFRQWVVEDKFSSGRPALETVGVTFTSDVAPYELMKIRILNGGHAAIAYPAGLLDIHFAHEAMEDPQIPEFLETLTKREILPVVPPPPQVDLEAYRRKVAERFANPKIGDTISRLCLDGSNRQPKFVLPTVRDRLKAGAGVKGLALVSALWCRYCYSEIRERQVDSAERSELGAPAGRREARTSRPSRIPRYARHLRRACRHESLCRRVLRRARFALDEGRARDAGRLSSGRRVSRAAGPGAERKGTNRGPARRQGRARAPERKKAMAGELDGKVAAVTGAASGIGLASAEAMLSAGARVMMIDRDPAALKALSQKHGAAVTPLVIDLLDPKDCATLLPRILRGGGPPRYPARQRRRLPRRRSRRRRHGLDRPDAEPECQRGDEERPRRAASHDRAPDGRHHRDELLGGSLSDAMGARLCIVQMGNQLLCSDGAATGVQARRSRGLDLARSRRDRAARGLAAGEAERGKGVRKSLGGERGRRGGDVHADAAARHDDPRCRDAAHQFRSLSR